MRDNTKISVIIPTYNNARYLPECLDSVLSQTCQDFEIVIVDDGSQDGSHELLLDYQSHYPDKIRYFWHPAHVNKGVIITSNLAIQKAKGEFVARIDSDDIWYPEKLDQQISILDSHREIGLVYSHTQCIDGSGNNLSRLEGSDVTRAENPLGLLLISLCVPQSTFIVRHRILDQVGLYDESFLYSDWDLMVRIFSHHKAAFIDTPLAKYRIHDHNLSKGNDPKVELDRIITVFRKLEQKSSSIGGALLENRNQAILDLQLAFHIFCEGDKEQTVAYLHRAFQKDPSLDSDTAFFNSWLNQWKPAFYTVDHDHFGFWVIAHLPPSVTRAVQRELADLQLSHPNTIDFFVRRGIQRGLSQNRPVDLADIFDDCSGEIPLSKSWKEEVLKKVYPALLFDSYRMGDVPKTQHYWKKAVQLDPAWLRNRGVWSIGLKALLGGRTMKSVGG
jgi:glycosyltransferase involved in cell wall biosynthesis